MKPAGNGVANESQKGARLAPADALGRDRQEHLLWVLSAATFLIFFQAYMVAPLIPKLSAMFAAPAQSMGLIVPAYLMPYGVSTLIYGLLSDRIGRRRIMLASLTAFVVLTALTAAARSLGELLTIRFLAGLGASGVVPLALALIGHLYPFEQRGRPLGWLFGAMAGGAAFGSSFGVLAEPLVGWRGLFLGTSGLALVALVMLLPHRRLLGEAPQAAAPVSDVLSGYRSLLSSPRGRWTYAFVLVNATFHSGVFTWLGLYFAQRYGLGEVGIGLALLGYGVPGLLLGPAIGRAADRWGRRWLLPAGVGIAGAAALFLVPGPPVVVAAVMVTLLSLGYDMTQPLLAGIVTALGGRRGGQAMGLNVFTLFTGFGLGSLLFATALDLGFAWALALFATLQFGAALAAVRLFRTEVHGTAPATARRAP